MPCRTCRDGQMLKLNEGCGRSLGFFIGVIISFAIGAMVDASKPLHLDKNAISCFYIVPACVAMWVLYPEKIIIGIKSLYCLVFGMLAGIVSYYAFGQADIVIHYSNQSEIIWYFIYIAAAAPTFEELAVRRLMFIGASNFIGPILSAISVSTLFALTHLGTFVVAFTASIILCSLAWKNIDTVNRSLMHGGYNLALTLLLFKQVF